jgi:hypothetical protein
VIKTQDGDAEHIDSDRKWDHPPRELES